MKKITPFILLLQFSYLCGCSIPSAAKYTELYTFTKEQHRIKGKIGKGANIVIIKDFRGHEIYDEDINALKERVENYILKHPDLSETAKDSLRKLKVGIGATQEEVKLLLGEPLKTMQVRNKDGSLSRVWIYRLNKVDSFSLFILPVFLVHQAYYLYFKDALLADVERRYLSQSVYQSGGAAPQRPSD